jgi:hypothetical protein
MENFTKINKPLGKLDILFTNKLYPNYFILIDPKYFDKDSNNNNTELNDDPYLNIDKIIDNYRVNAIINCHNNIGFLKAKFREYVIQNEETILKVNFILFEIFTDLKQAFY